MQTSSKIGRVGCRSNINLSPYVRSLRLSPDSSTYAFYNLEHDSLVILTADIGKAIINNDFSALSQDELSILLNENILTTSSLSECEQGVECYKSYCKSSEITCATICVTTICNLSCPYCFQTNAEKRFHMSDATANDVSYQILERARMVNSRTIDITFTGGEPLLNPNAITKIASSIFEQCYSSNQRNFAFNIITNGTLLTPTIVKEFQSIGLYGIQVTLDGPSAVHDKRRFFNNGKGTYKLILSNIREIDVPIGINVVVDNSNVLHLNELIEELSTYLKDKPNFMLSFSIREGVPGARSSSAQPIEKQQRMEILHYIQESFITTVRAGFGLTRPGLWTPCTAYRANSTVFGPDGSQLKCINILGNPSICIASSKQATWESLSTELPSYCKECDVMPICFGGCRFSNLAFNREFNQIFCLYPELKGLIDSYIRAIVEQEQGL